MAAMHKYVAHLTDYHKQSGWAKNPEEFKKIVWNDIKDGYKYGYHDWEDFEARVKVERIEEKW